MLKYCLKWETPFKTGFKLPIGRRLRLGGNTMRLVHVQGDLYTGMDTATLLANHNELKHGPWEEKTSWVYVLKSVLLLQLILLVSSEVFSPSLRSAKKRTLSSLPGKAGTSFTEEVLSSSDWGAVLDWSP